nr:serine/arginine repetitive matrix protein 1 isoform X1 [Tanacetum cinerariifolium]
GDQDTQFSNKHAKLLKSQKFHPELENLVDMTKVNIDVMRPWIAHRLTELGFEDEVLINFIYGLLEGKVLNGKKIQISLTGFMEKNTRKFLKELWTRLLNAQENVSGIPQQFLDAKEEETRKKQEDVIPVRRSVRTHKAPDRLCLNVEIDPDRLCFNVEVEEHSLGDLNEPANYKATLSDLEFEKDEAYVECSLCFGCRIHYVCCETIKAIRSDNGGEYISQEFKDYLKACGIVQQLTPPYTPQHNGVSERRNQSAARILNMVPTKKVDKTLYELWYGKVPNLSYLKIWGYEAHVKRHMPDKLQQRTVKCIFVGYPKETMGYYFYYPPENKIVVERYADFLEKDFILQKESGRIIELKDEDILPSENTSEYPIEEEKIDPYRLCFNVEVEEHSLGDLNKPANYKATLSGHEFEKWLVDMNAEMQSMYDNKFWRLVVLPPNAKVVKSKWIYKKKTNMDGTNSGEAHWTAMKNILKYLRNTKDMFLVYGGDPEAELRVNYYCDAGFETDRDDTKSQTGKFIDELGVIPLNDYLIKMNYDTSAAIIMAKESGIHKGARHFKRKYHYVHKCIETSKIDIVKVHTYDNLAYPFTKALAGTKLTRHARSMGLHPACSFM